MQEGYYLINEIFSKQNYDDNKVLSCAEPMISSYPHHSCYMSVLGNDDNYIKAILDAYIPLSFNASYRRLDFSIGIDVVEFMEHLPFLEGKYVDRKFIRQYNIKYTDYIKENITSDYYVYLLVDYYYISINTACFKKHHRIHDLFIYGYDDKKNVFLAKDFLDGRKYDSFEVSYEEMEQAASNLELERDWLRGIKSYKRKSMIHEEIFFHTPVIFDEIIKYVNGEKSGYASFNDIRKRQDCQYYYGVNIYDQIMIECTYRYENEEIMDARCFHILFEHKKCLLSICQNLNKDYKLNNVSDILEQFQNILNISYILRNMSLAYNVHASEKSYKSILKFLALMRDEETKAMTSLAQNIIPTTQFQSLINKKIIDLNDAALEFDPNWQPTTNKYALFTKVENAHMQTLFYGTDVHIVMDDHYFDENIKITIDEVDSVYVTSSVNHDHNESVCKISGLVSGIHKLKLTNTKGMCSIKKLLCFNAETESCTYPNASHCEMIDMDQNTKGNWQNIYGTKGFYIIGGEHKIPEYMTEQSIKFRNAYPLVWDTDSLDERALVNPLTNKRIMVYQENEKEFDINIMISGQIKREVSLYFADYERLNTDLTLQVFAKNSTKLLNETKLTHVDDGVYITYQMLGDIVVKVHKEKGRLALISGLFFQS